MPQELNWQQRKVWYWQLPLQPQLASQGGKEDDKKIEVKGISQRTVNVGEGKYFGPYNLCIYVSIISQSRTTAISRHLSPTYESPAFKTPNMWCQSIGTAITEHHRQVAYKQSHSISHRSGGWDYGGAGEFQIWWGPASWLQMAGCPCAIPWWMRGRRSLGLFLQWHKSHLPGLNLHVLITLKGPSCKYHYIGH